MARDKSAILSAEDKKAVLTDLKMRIKEGKTFIKNTAIEAKALEKTYITSLKQMTKTYQLAAKDFDHIIAAETKATNKLEANLAAITQS